MLVHICQRRVVGILAHVLACMRVHGMSHPLCACNTCWPQRQVAPTANHSTFCTNCCVPARGPTCAVCGHPVKADAVVVGPEVTNVWKQHMQQAARANQSAAGRRGRSRHSAAVALAFDERMLLHRASLAPYPERWASLSWDEFLIPCPVLQCTEQAGCKCLTLQMDMFSCCYL